MSSRENQCQFSILMFPSTKTNELKWLIYFIQQIGYERQHHATNTFWTINHPIPWFIRKCSCSCWCFNRPVGLPLYLCTRTHSLLYLLELIDKTLGLYTSIFKRNCNVVIPVSLSSPVGPHERTELKYDGYSGSKNCSSAAILEMCNVRRMGH